LGRRTKNGDDQAGNQREPNPKTQKVAEKSMFKGRKFASKNVRPRRKKKKSRGGRSINTGIEALDIKQNNLLL